MRLPTARQMAGRYHASPSGWERKRQVAIAAAPVAVPANPNHRSRPRGNAAAEAATRARRPAREPVAAIAAAATRAGNQRQRPRPLPTSVHGTARAGSTSAMATFGLRYIPPRPIAPVARVAPSTHAAVRPAPAASRAKATPRAFLPP